MARHIWSVLCGKMMTDQASNNVSLIDIVEQLNVTAQKVKKNNSSGEETLIVPFGGQLVSLWCRDDLAEGETVTGRTRIISPTGHELGKAEYTVDLTDHRRVRSVFAVNGLPVRIGENGNYLFTVERRGTSGEWEMTAEVPVQIEIAITEIEGGDGAP